MKFKVGDLVIIEWPVKGTEELYGTRGVVVNSMRYSAIVNTPEMENIFGNKAGLTIGQDYLELDPIMKTPLYEALK